MDCLLLLISFSSMFGSHEDDGREGEEGKRKDLDDSLFFIYSKLQRSNPLNSMTIDIIFHLLR